MNMEHAYHDAQNGFVVLDLTNPHQYNPLAGLERFDAPDCQWAELLDMLFPTSDG